MIIDAEQNRHFLLAIDQNMARITQFKNKSRETWHTIFTTYISKHSTGTAGSLTVNYALD